MVLCALIGWSLIANSVVAHRAGTDPFTQSFISPNPSDYELPLEALPEPAQ
jgi:hypothetical protein